MKTSYGECFFTWTHQTQQPKDLSEREMSSGGGERGSRWSVFDGVKTIPSTPESLMVEIDSAISASEYAHATLLLQASSSSSSSSSIKKISDAAAAEISSLSPQYDVRLADEAYKAGCAALAVGKLDDALHSLQIALSKCPPQKTSAVAKLQNLISLTSHQIQKTPS